MCIVRNTFGKFCTFCLHIYKPLGLTGFSIESNFADVSSLSIFGGCLCARMIFLFSKDLFVFVSGQLCSNIFVFLIIPLHVKLSQYLVTNGIARAFFLGSSAGPCSLASWKALSIIALG